MTYYAFVKNEKIIGIGQARLLNDGVLNIEVSQEIYDACTEDLDKCIYKDGKIIINPEYEEIKAQKRRAEFERRFFNTSLGWISREVHMKTGDIKDFLHDILGILEVGVDIVAYTTPDFYTDNDPTSSRQTVTQQFIAECKKQVLTDFYGAV